MDTENDTTAWMKFGACREVDPDIFFPDVGVSTREAKRVCEGCVVKSECLEFALATKEDSGVWGGASEEERRAELRRRRRQRLNGAL